MNHSSKHTFELSPKRRALLEALLQEEGVAPSAAQRIPRRKEINALPLSFAQQRLWFLEQWEAGKLLYNISRSLSLSGPLHKATLEQSLNEIIRRHEALRTTFPVADGQPFQFITPSLTLPLPVVELTALPQLERETETQRLIAQEAQRPFDLAQ